MCRMKEEQTLPEGLQELYKEENLRRNQKTSTKHRDQYMKHSKKMTHEIKNLTQAEQNFQFQ